ncbi:MAG: hypothetical protein OHK0039_39010 [Bacteroidia bacterium]
MTPLLLYTLAFLIVIHEVFLLVGLLRKPTWHKNWYALLMSISMIGLTLGSVFLQHWRLLTLGFASYRLFVMVELLMGKHRSIRNLSPLLPVNLFMVSGALLAYVFEWWPLVFITYVIFWSLTLWVARRIIKRSL